MSSNTLNAYIGGILGFIILILDLIAIFEIFQSDREPLWKFIWVVFILVFPVFGCLIYYFCSNRDKHKSKH
ncbi:hypothetical protein RhiirA5_507299 [Rhizophagus irregularis]|uniref:Cardiolipin synthase N-terminal domain-containing protein n=6 Tax=Rhizophagus irregularis TaxID=588596 RepID=A0A2N0NLG5_9GLOM|nr:hypothetical protein GLOIN_2v1623773 [Rhizophagus irregularis DAOM 181602=DAOM 197198]EXX55280.1 hypothetical protein RirG_226790 [Rhizophagus irregularis DAOM 197198w]PKB95428.1 hypothetical protein RhiirA5_507299 [Rhizophagus irregularis]POG69728.1 hypothetical protein GLOIN_2v1623773 [Rhizophagus irregularis DAOM 181602=DAOM 197198]UZO29483.1 hypothetical protein OCT59_022955 [Rhizophagus irregularis]UZO29484.1 hypothetical protein OCT59_022955 [Rhizophagus irregularis]|eukprot:XP_025176594.1 hypothetical protein GLOIN_2v1623773 [Rhizophagus irregularis DAOM 181602=DAOM 197198]